MASYYDGSSFDFATRLGLVFIVQAASLSAIAVTCVLAYIAYNSIKASWQGQRRSSDTEIHCYFVNLMIFDLISAMGSIFHIKWIANAGVEEGHFCTLQGATKQLGDTGVALASLAIGIHTFCVIVFRWDAPRRIAILVSSLIWLFVILIVFVPLAIHKGGVTFEGHFYPHYYGNTTEWCWITRPYVKKEGVGLQIAWMWIAVAANTMIYLFLALYFMGVVVDRGSKLKLRKWEQLETLGTKKMTSIAKNLLFYPIVYIITVLPLSVNRLINISEDVEGSTIPPGVIVSAAVLFSLSGLLNVILFTCTRPGLIRSRQVPRFTLAIPHPPHPPHTPITKESLA